MINDHWSSLELIAEVSLPWHENRNSLPLLNESTLARINIRTIIIKLPLIPGSRSRTSILRTSHFCNSVSQNIFRSLSTDDENIARVQNCLTLYNQTLFLVLVFLSFFIIVFFRIFVFCLLSLDHKPRSKAGLKLRSAQWPSHQCTLHCTV